MKLMHFKSVLFSNPFLNRFLWISGVSWKLKPWIPYGRGNKNHNFARIRFFTVSAPIWEPFCSPKRTKDPVLAHLGALGIEFSIRVASTF